MKAIRWQLNEGRPREQQIPAIFDVSALTDAQGVPNCKLMISRNEIPDQTRHRLQSYGTSENSHHGAIVSNPWHSQSVTAYDLALGEPIHHREALQRLAEHLKPPCPTERIFAVGPTS